MTKRSLLLFFIAVLGISVQGAAKTIPKKSSKPGYDEVLRLDVWTSYAPPVAIEDFKKYIYLKYKKKIDIEVRRVLSPDEFFFRVRASKTDIISPAHNFIKDERANFIEHRLLLPIETERIPNLAHIADRFKKNNFISHANQIYAVPIATGGYSLLYNKANLNEAPLTWNVLWDPKYKKKYALSRDFYEANIYITALALGYKPHEVSDIEKIDTPVFKAKLKTLLENAHFWQGAPESKDLEALSLTTAWGLSHSVKNDRKKNWIFSTPKEGMSAWTDYLSLTKAVQRSPFAKTLALEWMNFVLSPDFQFKYVVTTSNYLSPNTHVAQHIYESDTKEKQKETNAYLKNHTFLWPILTTRNRNGLKLIHDEVLREISSTH